MQSSVRASVHTSAYVAYLTAFRQRPAPPKPIHLRPVVELWQTVLVPMHRHARCSTATPITGSKPIHNILLPREFSCLTVM